MYILYVLYDFNKKICLVSYKNIYIASPSQVPSINPTYSTLNPTQMPSTIASTLLVEKCATKQYCESVNQDINHFSNSFSYHTIDANDIPDDILDFPSGFDQNNVYLSDFTLYINGTHGLFSDLRLSIQHKNTGQGMYLNGYDIANDGGIFDFGLSNNNS